MFFQSRSGGWAENLRERLVNGVWLWAIRVGTQEPKQKTPHYFYDIEKGYPQKQKDIDWDH